MAMPGLLYRSFSPGSNRAGVEPARGHALALRRGVRPLERRLLGCRLLLGPGRPDHDYRRGDGPPTPDVRHGEFSSRNTTSMGQPTYFAARGTRAANSASG